MKISIIIPAYNAERTLYLCLKSIFGQSLPKKDYEVIFLEGYSTDRTYEIAKKFPVRLIRTHDTYEEPRRILGLKLAKAPLVLMLDTDNILPDKDWLKKMIKPFKDPEIDYADALYFTYRATDPIRVRYHALIGGDDPIAMYLGLYSKWAYVTNDWTGYPYVAEDRGNYVKARFLNPERIPAMGSNGFIIRTKILRKFVKDKYIHQDIMYELAKGGYSTCAKVKTSIVHDQPDFWRSKSRRVKRRIHKHSNYTYGLTTFDYIKTIVYLGLIIPVLFDTLKGFIRKPSFAWLYHPVATFGLLGIYGWYKIIGRLGLKVEKPR